MFAIEVSSTFSAAHALRLPGGTLEPLHGHDFHVTVKIACDLLDELETVVDFHEVEAALTIIVQGWRNQNLNTVEPFKTKINPSAEQIAAWIGSKMSQEIQRWEAGLHRKLRLIEVRVTEAANCLAIWSPS